MHFLYSLKGDVQLKHHLWMESVDFKYNDIRELNNIISLFNMKIGKNVSIGNGAYLYKDCIIGDNVRIGERSRIFRNVELGEYVTIPSEMSIPPNMVIPPYCHIARLRRYYKPSLYKHPIVIYVDRDGLASIFDGYITKTPMEWCNNFGTEECPLGDERIENKLLAFNECITDFNKKLENDVSDNIWIYLT